MNTQHKDNKAAFQLKGSVLTLSVIQLLTFDVASFAKQLEETVQKNPQFFTHMPVIIDLQKLYSIDQEINFSEINSLLRQSGLVPVGITNANPNHTAGAATAGLGILPNVKTTPAPKTKKMESTKIVTQPIRSGQQIYAKNSDLVVLASVSNGAEVLADGSIHIYGNLRGRAIAGANGDLQARIFCQKLEAELVAIAGYYMRRDDIVTTEMGNTQIFLENDQLMIASLTT